MQHGDAIGQRQHAVDIVLDQQYRVCFRELSDQGANDLPVRFGQTRERLVQQ